MIKAGIIGGGGYTAGELIRLLLSHSKVEIAFVVSNSQQGKPIATVHDDLVGDTDLLFAAQWHWDIDVLFLCMGHGASATFMSEQQPPDDLCIIDLSRDFRLTDQFVYGLPELNRSFIAGHKRIANPGCFATAIQLALLPLAERGYINKPVNIHAITGSTGAGQSPRATTHFSWRQNNVSVYKAFKHQHLGEIKRSLKQLQGIELPPLHFLPLRGTFTRGIFASVYLESDLREIDALNLYQEFYADAPFTTIGLENPHLKQVVNTNKCILHVEKHDGQLLIISCIDNLLKGASGQALQNMNLAFGWPEITGLQLKATYF